MQAIRKSFSLFLHLFALTILSTPLLAQGQSSKGSTYLVVMLLIVGALVLFGAIAALGDSFLSVEAQKVGVDLDSKKGAGFNLFGTPTPSYVGGDSFKRFSKGYDLKLAGEADGDAVSGNAKRFSVSPKEYRGMSPIPKVVVSEGDTVKAGDTILFDKKNDKVKFVAPVSGEIVEIRRAEKRSISDVVILADAEMDYLQLDPPSIAEASREEIVDFLCAHGGWTLLNQRPYDVMPAVDAVPKAIFVSTFDSAPLAPDANVVVAGREEAFQKGIDTLARLSGGDVHIGLNGGGDAAPAAAFAKATNCKKHWFAGKHPAGNVGVQIHHIDAIKPGDKVWTLGVQEVITLGELMYKGIYNSEKTVAITGSQVGTPAYVKTYAGASIDELLKDNLKEGKNRIIDGDVLSGLKAKEDGFLRSKSDQITVIKEGDEYELFGWLLPIKARPTISKTFPNFFYPNMKFEGETNTHGERRAFVMTGQYESVLPMDIYPQHLMKAILANDYERMEGLGITELSEEDLAVCEFVCTSKQPLQSILREGLDMMRDQE